MDITAPSEEWVLGLGGSSHDFAAALARGTDIQVAIEAERVTRKKYVRPLWYEDPSRSCVDYCLETANISRDQLSRVVSCDLLPHRARARFDGIPVHIYPHHLAHAASVGMLLEPTESAVIMVIDGMGSPCSAAQRAEVNPEVLPNFDSVERETFSFFTYENGDLTPIGATRGQGFLEYVDLTTGAKNSIGLLYEMITAMLGFHPLETGKTMGLAPWGRPRFLDLLLDFTSFGDDLNHVFAFDPYDLRFQETVTRVLEREECSFTVRADVAASVQALFTRTLMHCYELVADPRFDAVCIAGGCGLNSVANGVLADRLDGRARLVVPPHTSDAGIALGALWLDRHRAEDSPVKLTLANKPLIPNIARPGRLYSAQERRTAAAAHYRQLALDTRVTSAADLAKALAEGKVIGVFNGPSEIGPRALGGRSVLADPRDPATRERINRRIKHREPFRPLAPIVLTEHFDEYFFPAAAKDYYMLVVAQANQKCRLEAPSVVHVDGSARVQIVDEDSDPFLAEVLREFYSLTGLPILLNTSFNRRGEPIVESPDDAIRAFLEMGLDGLYLEGDFYFSVNAQEAG
ncbi:carbamoyltransferase C-terminal domain-containing protein [Streptomyces sp. OE57]|uniref:carbamoyltransferase C-terminal domain-containing protein n=1 Tax=Streptomyces lacaronensis TaxID=3379885 RepID=UPI0039B7848F